MGGLGIRGAEDHGPVAYAVSYLSSRPLVSKLLNLNEEDPANLPQGSLPHTTLPGECSVRETARLASLDLAHAGDWLNLVPFPALGLHLRPQIQVGCSHV